ncbi:ribonuclease VapC [Azospirillaceae bacterium]
MLDSSAVLAVLLDEAGADRVTGVLPGALLSAVNLSEGIGKLCERGMPASEAGLAVAALGADIVAFDEEQAKLAGELRPLTRAAGLSLGDRACLALSRLRRLPAMTTDAAWLTVSGSEIILIRGTH